MTLNEFENVLKQLTPGQGAHVPYDTYRELFPPGEPDAAARARAYEFAFIVQPLKIKGATGSAIAPIAVR